MSIPLGTLESGREVPLPDETTRHFNTQAIRFSPGFPHLTIAATHEGETLIVAENRIALNGRVVHRLGELSVAPENQSRLRDGAVLQYIRSRWDQISVQFAELFDGDIPNE